MERLKKKDAEAGIEQTTLTDAQRAAIAEGRSVFKLAASPSAGSCTSARTAAIFDPQELELHREHLVRDLAPVRERSRPENPEDPGTLTTRNNGSHRPA